MNELVKETISKNFKGCDFVVKLDKKSNIRLLQITDMQFIDSTQMRTPDRLPPAAAAATTPEFFDKLCGNHIRYLVNLTNPDLIFITGDMVYGSFDDKGTTFQWFCRLMDSFRIPWAPVFGNHDTESKMGVEWQCKQLENSEYCLFKAGNVSGYGNYTVGIACGNELLRQIHMLDSHLGLKLQADILPDQLDMVKNNSTLANSASGKTIPGFLCFHVPTTDFPDIEAAKGYTHDDKELFSLDGDTPAKDGDFGIKANTPHYYVKTDKSFIPTLKESGIDGVFVGHEHKNNYCISYDEIKWVYGVKTGNYDSRIKEKTGGTLITLNNEKFKVDHVLYPYF